MPEASEAEAVTAKMVSPRASRRKGPPVLLPPGGLAGRSLAQSMPSAPCLKDAARDFDAVALGKRSSMGQKRNVSFNDVIAVEVPHIDHPARTDARRPEEIVKKNMDRLASNHRKLLKGCSICGDNVCCHVGLRLLGLFGQGLGLLPALSGHHARIQDDVLLVGNAPGVFETAILLSGATVGVKGCEVEVHGLDQPLCSIRLKTPQKAEQLARRARQASTRLEDALDAVKQAAKIQAMDRSMPGQETCGDVGGTP